MFSQPCGSAREGERSSVCWDVTCSTSTQPFIPHPQLTGSAHSRRPRLTSGPSQETPDWRVFKEQPVCTAECERLFV